MWPTWGWGAITASIFGAAVLVTELRYRKQRSIAMSISDPIKPLSRAEIREIKLTVVLISQGWPQARIKTHNQNCQPGVQPIALEFVVVMPNHYLVYIRHIGGVHSKKYVIRSIHDNRGKSITALPLELTEQECITYNEAWSIIRQL